MSNWENRPRGFWHGMHVYASLVVFFVGVALIVLWVWLPGFQSRYEAEEAEKQRQDDLVAYDKALERAPQLAFEDFMAKADAQTWTDAWTAKNPLNYDDPADPRAAGRALLRPGAALLACAGLLRRAPALCGAHRGRGAGLCDALRLRT